MVLELVKWWERGDRVVLSRGKDEEELEDHREVCACNDEPESE